MEAKNATQADRSRTQREDFRASSDPALQEGGRHDVKLLDYEQLYNLWERQQWATQDLDFSQDRIDWHERIPEKERFQRMYGLSSFFIGEQRSPMSSDRSCGPPPPRPSASSSARR